MLVTGFEPFGEHSVNASWVAVQELERLGLREGVELHVCEVPVEYQAVQSLLPSLWKQHQPQLVVHVGVSGIATTVTLEQYGHNHGYCRLDNCRWCPDSQCCVEEGPDRLSSVLDMGQLCSRLTSPPGLGVALSVSKDAGRYLCDYTYYTSLYLGQGRAAFVHVPPLGRPYSGPELGRALQGLVGEMLQLLERSPEDDEDEDSHQLCPHHHHHHAH